MKKKKKNEKIDHGGRHGARGGGRGGKSLVFLLSFPIVKLNKYFISNIYGNEEHCFNELMQVRFFRVVVHIYGRERYQRSVHSSVAWVGRG